MIGHVFDFLNTIAASGLDVSPLPRPDNAKVLPTIFKIVWGITGAISLLVITGAGLRYVASGGKPEEVAQAKNTIIYAIVGLVVSISGFTIVNYVVGRLS